MPMHGRNTTHSTIPHPYKGAERFYTLDELRTAVNALEQSVRDMGLHPAEVFFQGDTELAITITSAKLTDGSCVLNASIGPAAPY